MMKLHEQGLLDLARASCASGHIIEAHSDHEDRICRVVVDMGDKLRHLPLREAILQQWMKCGFVVSTSRDGTYLMIDGLTEQAGGTQMDLVHQVAEQIKRFTFSHKGQRSNKKLNIEPEMAFLAAAALENQPARPS